MTFNGSRALGDFEAEDDEVVASEASDDETDEQIEWRHGDYNQEQYRAALARSQKDFKYDSKSGIPYNKVRILVFGRCFWL